jgi:sarcosine oxidase subunit gamma
MMSDLNSDLYATSSFGAKPLILAPSKHELTVSDRHGVGIATVLATRGQIPLLARRIREDLGLELPSGPQRVAAGEIAFAATGPGAWLVTCESGGKVLSTTVRPVVEGLGAMTDQTGAYGILRLSGSRVRDLLCKLVPIDLHPRAFRVGDVGNTSCGHMGATLWRLADAQAGAPVFEIAVYRSVAKYFWRLLSQQSGEGARAPGDL